MSPFREIIAVLTPHSQRIANPHIARESGALNGPVTDRRASFTRRFRAVRVEEVAADVQQALAHQKPETV